MSTRRELRDLQAAMEAARIEEAMAAKRLLDEAVITVKAWHRAGIRALDPIEVLDLLTGRSDAQKPPEEGTLAAPAVHPRDAERDPLTGCLPASAPVKTPVPQ